MQQNLAMKQQLRMTQQLQQAIKLLQLSKLELIDQIQAELAENPTLEELDPPEGMFNRMEDGEPPAVPNDTQDLSSSLRNLDEDISKTDSIDWDAYINQYQTHTPLPETSYKGLITDELPSYEATLTAPPTLVEYLVRQIKLSRLDELQEKLACEIVGNINDDGYLIGVTLEELAAQVGIDIDSAEYVLETVQEMDPVGVGSRDLRECLLVQAELLYPDNELVHEIINKHIPLLERKNYDAIAKAEHTTRERILSAAKLIAKLNPKPGLKYHSDRTLYINPDVYVEKVGDEFHVVVNDDGLPKLHVSPYYSELLKSSGQNDAKASEYIRDKMSSARWFLRSIQQRERTIYKVTEAIVQRQREFFEKGIEYLKPMVLKDIADDTGLSESTISRVTNKKYVHTPQGTYELKFFFNSKISRATASYGDELASETVKEKLKEIIAKENPQKPYSDQKLAELLQEQDINIARRTIAKYRDMLGILSSSQRKSI